MKEFTNREIGDRIRIAREEKGYTKRELAEKVGIHESSIGRYENGEIRNAKVPVIHLIAKALNVNPMWLIGETEDKEDLNFVLEDAYFNFAKEMQEKNISQEDMEKLWQFYNMIKDS